ncbi:pyridoxamine 5'-phosphate oxidase family protein [Maribacter sp. 2307UL18-2]|uniref:pyridoxamine 5'-phosphate oxidase family protein n=1 Tax=Maribacter sp. 2307UL18-2 TaxID=3386274 RepID=UPI0039BD7621
MKATDYTKDKDGLQKMRSLLANTRVFMMATNLDKIPFSVCPMTLQDMDEQGDLWFFTPRDSDHFRAIEEDNRVQLIISNEQEQTYLSIYGNATHIVDDEKLNQLWNPMLKAWFNGKNDPNLALLNINMESAYFWNNDENNMVSLYHLIQAARTGNKSEMGEKGHVNLQNH